MGSAGDQDQEEETSSDREVEIRREVAALAANTPDTRVLIRETAAILFFRYGENPSGNRVRQLTNRGSMVTIHDEIKHFWADVRKRLKVRITQPELPPELLDEFGAAAAKLWENAQNRARDSLAVHKAEADKAVEEARQAVRMAEEAQSRSHHAAQKANAQREETQQQLAAESAARVEALNEVERWRQQAEQSARDLEKARGDFQVELEKLTNSLELAQLQYRDMEKRMMLEVDAVRTRIVEVREMLQKRETELSSSRETERIVRAQLHQAHIRAEDLVAECAELKGRLAALEVENTRKADQLEAANRRLLSLADVEGRLAAISEERDTLRAEIARTGDKGPGPNEGT